MASRRVASREDAAIEVVSPLQEPPVSSQVIFPVDCWGRPFSTAPSTPLALLLAEPTHPSGQSSRAVAEATLDGPVVG